MFDKYKSKQVTLRIATHENLQNLSTKVKQGDRLSIPRTIEYLKDFYDTNSSNSQSNATKGNTNGIQKKEISQS